MNDVALITGASSGIGKELAKVHAWEGGDLVLVARRKKELEALKKELEKGFGIEVKIIVKDLTEPNATKEIYLELAKEKIEVDYLINNAGFGGIGKFFERNWSDDEAMIKLNIMALTSLTRYFLPDFVKRNKGRILNVSSTASLFPGPLQAVYFATKAYVTSFSEAVAEELRGTEVTVTTLMPGATETGFGTISGMNQTPLFKKTFSAKEVAQTGYQAMLKGKLEVLTGLSLGQRILMRLTPLLPKRAVLKTIHHLQTPRKHGNH